METNRSPQTLAASAVIANDRSDRSVNIGRMASGLEHTKASSYAIYELLDLVENGGIRIPRFQRGQRWGPSDVVKLFDSLYKGYPVGTLLLWKRLAPKADVTLGSVQIRAPERTDALWVVDGQQRITSLATALLPTDGTAQAGPALYFDLHRERFGWRRPGDPRDTYLPVREAYKLPRVMAWLRERNLEERMQDRAFKLADRLRNYQIPTYAVETEVEGDLGSLREIFDRINTFGKRMTRAEVFHALTSSDTPEGRDLPYLADRIASKEWGNVKDSTLMMCILSMDGPNVLRDFRTEFAHDPERLSNAIDRADTAIGRAVVFLGDAGVPHLDLVPYQYLLVGLVRFFALHRDPSEWERVLLRRWYWRAAVHGPLPKRGPTGTLRLILNTIDGQSAIQTLLVLLEEFPVERRRAKADAMRWNQADTKTTLCALASLKPIDPYSGNGEEPTDIDIGAALSANRDSALPRVFASARGPLAGSPANRVFWQADLPSLPSRDTSDLRSPNEIEHMDDTELSTDPAVVLALTGSEVLASHAISESAAAALRHGDADGFLAARHTDIQRTVEDFVDSRAEWDHPARPSLASL